MMEHWGEGRSVEVLAPRLTDSAVLRQAEALFERASASPAMARKMFSAAMRLDVRDILPAIRVPMGFLAGAGSPMPVDGAAGATARAIPGAWLDVVEGAGHLPWFERPGSVRGALHRLASSSR